MHNWGPRRPLDVSALHGLGQHGRSLTSLHIVCLSPTVSVEDTVETERLYMALEGAAPGMALGTSPGPFEEEGGTRVRSNVRSDIRSDVRSVV